MVVGGQKLVDFLHFRVFEIFDQLIQTDHRPLDRRDNIPRQGFRQVMK